MPTFVSMGPGAMAFNLNPYLPHSAASDLHTHTHTLKLSNGLCVQEKLAHFVRASTPALAAALGATKGDPRAV